MARIDGVPPQGWSPAGTWVNWFGIGLRRSESTSKVRARVYAYNASRVTADALECMKLSSCPLISVYGREASANTVNTGSGRQRKCRTVSVSTELMGSETSECRRSLSD